MGVKLVDEVIQHSPRLPDAEWKLLVILAADARDATRRCWPGAGVLEDATGKAESTVRRLLGNLEDRKLIRRIEATRRPGAAPVVAHRGHRTVFELLPMPGRKALTSEPLSPAKAAHPRAERGPVLSSKGPTSEPPSRHVPSGPVISGPVAIDDATIAAVREELRLRTGTDVGDVWATRVAAELLAGRIGITSPPRYLRTIINRERDPSRWLPIALPGYQGA